jgi:hypothetical protein
MSGKFRLSGKVRLLLVTADYIRICQVVSVETFYVRLGQVMSDSVR